MHLIISPAKKMRVDTDGFPAAALPIFLDRTEELLGILQKMSPEELKSLWKCNDKILELNVQRIASMDLRQGLTPAILSYEGIQYQHMAPGVFTDAELSYVQAHLRILSGFYGILRPLDGVTPYRLEMQARLKNKNGENLYAFWGRDVADALFQETDCILNLASKEYSMCISPYLPSGLQMVTCIFGQRINGKVIEKGTFCKMARGEMVRFAAEHSAKRPEDLQEFCGMGYVFSPRDSTSEIYTFIREEEKGSPFDF